MNLTETRDVGATVFPNSTGASITLFSTGNGSIASVFPPNDPVEPFGAQLTAVGIGITTLEARATRGGVVCASDTINIDVTAPKAWWQIGRGNVFTRGDIRSEIPTVDSLILDDPASRQPGVAVYGGNPPYGYDFAAGASSGSVSSRNWLSSTNTSSNIYKYAYFRSLASGKQINPVSSNGIIRNGDVHRNGGGPDYNFIESTTADTTLESNITLMGGQKTVIFVQGNLRINNNISKINLDNSFLMFVVSGDIIVNSTVTEITGVYTTDGTFITESDGDDLQLNVVGSVAAFDVDLKRYLGAGNATDPAELFTYSPELVVNYPPALSERHLVWREVAP
jgi:hypothetical protein